MENQDFLLQFFVSSIVSNVLIFSLSDNRMLVPRYFLPILVWMIPTIELLLAREVDKVKRIIYTVSICGFFLITCMRTYYSLIKNDYNIYRYAIVDFLEENELLFGYASPQNAGILTELSNGEIEMAGLLDIELGEPWLDLCPKKYFYEDYYRGKSFLLLSIDEYSQMEHTDIVQKGKKYIVIRIT